MENRIDIETLKRTQKGSYTVPEGYFSDLNHRIVTCVAQSEQAPSGFWSIFSRAATFAGGFAFFVLLATVGYYFTGYQALQTELNDSNMVLLSLYDISDEEIMDLTLADASSDQLFTQAAVEYLSTYGYDEQSLVDNQ